MSVCMKACMYVSVIICWMQYILKMSKIENISLYKTIHSVFSHFWWLKLWAEIENRAAVVNFINWCLHIYSIYGTLNLIFMIPHCSGEMGYWNFIPLPFTHLTQNHGKIDKFHRIFSPLYPQCMDFWLLINHNERSIILI